MITAKVTPTTDPWYLVRSSLGQAAGEPDFEREQPMPTDLPEREEF